MIKGRHTRNNGNKYTIIKNENIEKVNESKLESICNKQNRGNRRNKKSYSIS